MLVKAGSYAAFFLSQGLHNVAAIIVLVVLKFGLFSDLGGAVVVVMQIQSKLIQSKLIWKFRDDLNNEISKVDMCKFLKDNEQTVPKRGCCE